MGLFYRLLIKSFFVLVLIAGPVYCRAQALLNRTVSLNVKDQTLADVLKSVSGQGGFYFSYNSDIAPQGKMVTLSVNHKTVKQVLDMLFDGKYQYKERGNYIIITDGEGYTISGYVVDKNTGDKIGFASVYEKQQLASTITNEQGYFKLKLKDKYPEATISVSKGMYADTFMSLATGFDQVLTLAITPKDYALDSIVVKPQIEKNWLASIFLSSRQRVQALNIGSFLAKRPVQTSFVPGLGTHGRLGAQVVNKFSLNVLGGYTAGANGVEIGGLFNIDKGDVKYVQVAGLFNAVGGNVTGVQLSGLYSSVLESVKGTQVSGLSSMAGRNVDGLQLSGLYNQLSGDLEGLQLCGLLNMAPRTVTGAQVGGIGNINGSQMDGLQLAGLFNFGMTVSGAQISGTGNISGTEMDGVQVSGVFNYARNLKGTQVGLVNIADSSSGYSIGLINVVLKNGYHELSVSANEVLNTNIALKTGTRRLYNILTAGANMRNNYKAYGIGYGIGKEVPLYRRLSLNTDFVASVLYLGDWRETGTSLCLSAELNFRINSWLALHAGPACSVYYQNAKLQVPGYSTGEPMYHTYAIGNNANFWVGWHAGVDIF